MKIDKKYKINYIAGERIVIMQGTHSVDMTKVISLNPTAEWLWKQLEDNAFNVNDVTDLLCQRFEVDREQAQKDAATWVETLRKNGIILDE